MECFLWLELFYSSGMHCSLGDRKFIEPMNWETGSDARVLNYCLWKDASTSRKMEDESVCFASFIRAFPHAIKNTLCLFSFLSLEQFPYLLHNRLSFDHSNICMIHCKTRHSSFPFCFTSTPSSSYSMDTFAIDS